MCCEKSLCIAKVEIEFATNVLLECLREKTESEHNNIKNGFKIMIMEKVNNCWNGRLTEMGYMQMSWTVGSGAYKLQNVCRQLFIHCYLLSHSNLDRICQLVKRGITNPNQANLNDNSNSFRQNSETDKVTLKDIQNYNIAHNIQLTTSQRAALHLPNNVVSLATYGWMSAYFKLVGDSQPNRDDEIHLEPVKVNVVYAVYKDEIREILNDNTIDAYSFSAFCKFWNEYFFHVKIREFKAVSGKCNTCAKLSELRKCSKIRNEKQLLTLFHTYHRSAYMNERMFYNQRKYLGANQRNLHLSIITDGMAQTHCELPHCGNQTTFNKKFSQHLQGILLHGRGMMIYRTFNTIKNSANLQIHTMLLTLEELRNKEVFYFLLFIF
jgi:hypothetical protein